MSGRREFLKYLGVLTTSLVVGPSIVSGDTKNIDDKVTGNIEHVDGFCVRNVDFNGGTLDSASSMGDTMKPYYARYNMLVTHNPIVKVVMV